MPTIKKIIRPSKSNNNPVPKSGWFNMMTNGIRIKIMGIKVLFIYPNTYGMNMLPPAIAMFSSILKKHGHEVQIFDTTHSRENSFNYT